MTNWKVGIKEGNGLVPASISPSVKHNSSSMLRLCLTLLAVGLSSAAIHNVCHSNDNSLTEAQVILSLTNLCNADGDNIIKEAEVVVGFAKVLDISLPLSEAQILDMDYNALIGLAGLFGFNINKAHFVDKWHAYFHDSRDFITATFDAFDENNNGRWSITEVDNIVNHIKTTTDNGDGVISVAEFVAYFNNVYENSC